MNHRLTEDICPKTKKEQDIECPSIQDLNFDNPVAGFGFLGIEEKT